MPSLLMLAMACLFALYHYRCQPAQLASLTGGGEDGQARAVYASRVAGALLLGLAPSLVLLALRPASADAYGLGAPDVEATALGVAILAGPALPAVWMASRRADFVDHYPPIRARRWSAGRIAANGLTWAVYLVAYELFFRGLLLFTLAARLDPWLAIALTTLAYVFAHLPKPGRETAGTVPMGVLFAAVTLWSGTIWAAVIAHWLIANASDLLAMRRRG